MSGETPTTEAELLEREARLAREALSSLKAEIADSLTRAADASAWTKRYPWASVGAAAAGGVAAGVAVGSVTSRSKPSAASVEAPPFNGQPVHVEVQSASTAPKQAGRLASGIGALASAALSAATVAATQAITDIVKTSIHEAMNPPQPQPEEPTDRQ